MHSTLRPHKHGVRGVTGRNLAVLKIVLRHKDDATMIFTVARSPVLCQEASEGAGVFKTGQDSRIQSTCLTTHAWNRIELIGPSLFQAPQTPSSDTVLSLPSCLLPYPHRYISPIQEGNKRTLLFLDVPEQNKGLSLGGFLLGGFCATLTRPYQN